MSVERPRRSPFGALSVLACVVAVALFPTPAHADRAILSRETVKTSGTPWEDVEGACGVATLGGKTYVSDYYHHAVDVFTGLGGYESMIPTGALDGPCGLATSPGGDLYANDWHRGVERLLPSAMELDHGESTGVAVDQTDGRVYVDDRTYVAVYEPSGEAVPAPAGGPLRIGVGSLSDGYGVAVRAGKVYVPDAGHGRIEVYEPASDAANPVATIDGRGTPQNGFSSLVDASIAVDPVSGHLVVVDDLQPGFLHPEAVIDEFDATGAFLGQVSTSIVDGGPSGLAFSGEDLLVTSGNDETSTVIKLGPYVPASASAAQRSSLLDGATAPVVSAPSQSADSLSAPSSSRPVSLRLRSLGSTGSRAIVRVDLSAAGGIEVRGAGLARLAWRRLAPGSHLLRVQLDGRALRVLQRSARHLVHVRARFSFRPSVGGPATVKSKRLTFNRRKKG